MFVSSTCPPQESDSMFGRKRSPWKRPKTTIADVILKKVMKQYDSELARKTRERKVVTPPCSTAGLMVTNALLVRSILVPLNQIQKGFIRVNREIGFHMIYCSGGKYRAT